jgi:hypothetical protein
VAGSAAEGCADGVDSALQILPALEPPIEAVQVNTTFALPFGQQRLHRQVDRERHKVKIGGSLP